jgi:endonuclease/exonuclease/phosphatase family metal-dependent hydrolase
MNKKPLSYLIAAATALMLPAALLFFTVATFMAYRPAPEEALYSNPQAPQLLPSSISVTSWNVGYCGLGKNADFFYDGGKMVRPEKEEVLENLQGVSSFLKANACDFLLLQEVDVDSKRSYGVNELRSIAGERYDESRRFFAYNYKAWFVPFPLFHPLGRVQAGVATLGAYEPFHVTRYAYPNGAPYPRHIFLLKRCFLACRYATQSGKELVLINTHNSAFDDGAQRAAEMEILRSFAVAEYERGSYVIVGGDWNQTPPGYENRAGTEQYTPHAIGSDFFPQGWQWVYDKTAETMRFANQPYVEGQSLTSVVDFFLVSPNVSAAAVAVHKLGFEHADHNPVTAAFELK